MLSKTQTYTNFTILEQGQVQLRLTTRIYDSGALISENHHREVREPGTSISDLPTTISSSIATFWTPEVLGDWDSFVSASLSDVIIPVSGSE